MDPVIKMIEEENAKAEKEEKAKQAAILNRIKNSDTFKNLELYKYAKEHNCCYEAEVLSDEISKKVTKEFKTELLKLLANESFRSKVKLDFDEYTLRINLLPANGKKLDKKYCTPEYSFGHYTWHLTNDSICKYSVLTSGEFYTNSKPCNFGRKSADQNGIYQFHSLYSLFVNLQNEFKRIYKNGKMFDSIISILKVYEDFYFKSSTNVIEIKDNQLYANIFKNIQTKYPKLQVPLISDKNYNYHKVGGLILRNWLYVANQSFEFHPKDQFNISLKMDTSSALYFELNISNDSHTPIQLSMTENINELGILGNKNRLSIEVDSDISTKYYNGVDFNYLPNLAHVNNIYTLTFGNEQNGLKFTNNLLESLSEIKYILTNYHSAYMVNKQDIFDDSVSGDESLHYFSWFEAYKPKVLKDFQIFMNCVLELI